MDMIIDFPGGARRRPFRTLRGSDRPAPAGGGQSSATTPFATFLSTVGTYAGIYVLGFCRQRGIPTNNIWPVQRIGADPLTSMVNEISVTIELPDSFPAKYADAGVRAADQPAWAGA